PDRGRCEFIKEFAEPYAARVLAIMLGIPESEWERMSNMSNRLSLALGVTIKENIDTIHDALAGLYAYADELISDRRANPGDDFVTLLDAASLHGNRFSAAVLRNALAQLIYARI